MKSKRRTFLKSGILAGLGSSFLWQEAIASEIKRKPIVISTWDFGKRANAIAWDIIANNGYVIDAIEKGIRLIEDDPEITTVGYGGFPDREGIVTLDACIMNEFMKCGSVAGMENIRHAVSIARAVMEKTPHVMLVGQGATQFAQEQGFEAENLLTETAKKAWKNWLIKSEYKPKINIENHDTIGMLAIDQQGRMGGACSTSGMAFKMHGRVGDSPIIGAGLFVDPEAGAATGSGHGEEVIRTSGAHTIVEAMQAGKSPEKACKIAVERVYKNNKNRWKDIQTGFIAIDREGRFGAYALQKGFSYSVQTEAGIEVKQADFLMK